MPLQGNRCIGGWRTAPTIHPAGSSLFHVQSTMVLSNVLPAGRSRVAEPVNNCCSRRGRSENKSNKYLPFWQRFDNCGVCSLLLTILSSLQHIAWQGWPRTDISRMFRYCELLNWDYRYLSRAGWSFRSLLNATALSVSILRVLLVTTLSANSSFSLLLLLQPRLFCILLTFGTGRVSFVYDAKFSFLTGSFASGGLMLAVSVLPSLRVLSAFMAFLIAPCLSSHSYYACARALHWACPAFGAYCSAPSCMARAWSVSPSHRHQTYPWRLKTNQSHRNF